MFRVVILALAGFAAVACGVATQSVTTRAAPSPSYTHRDSLALAGLDSLIRAFLIKQICQQIRAPDEMPVIRGDSSGDTLMVLKVVPSRPPIPYDQCDKSRTRWRTEFERAA